MHFAFTVTSKVETTSLDGSPRFTFQGQFAAYASEGSEPVEMGMLAIPTDEANFEAANIGNVIVFTEQP